MSFIGAKRLSQKLCASVWRNFVSKAEKKPYWRVKFPDRIASFDEIPTVTENITDLQSNDSGKYHEVAEELINRYGYVLKEPLPNGDESNCNVHLFHVEDFSTVYLNDRKHSVKSYNLAQSFGRTEIHGHSQLSLNEDSRSFLAMANYKTFGSKRMFEEVGDDLITIIRTKLNDRNEIELFPWLHRWTLESTGIFTLNKRMNSLLEDGRNQPSIRLISMTRDVLIALMDPMTENSMYDYLRMHVVFFSFLKLVLADAKEIEMDLGNGSFIQFLHRKKEYCEDEVIDILINVFHGSQQTVPRTVLMALYNIARNKNIQVQAREELMKYLPTASTRYYSTKIPETFTLTEKIMWETLRLHSPIICSGRVTDQEMVLGGYHIPKKTNVILHFQVACHLKEFYEDPLKFNPDRFKEEKNVGTLSNQVFRELLRACMGSVFARDQITFILSKLLRNFEFSYYGGEIDKINHLSYQSEEPLFFKVKPLTC